MSKLFVLVLLVNLSCTTHSEDVLLQEITLSEPQQSPAQTDMTDLSNQNTLKELEALDFITPPEQPCQKIKETMQQEQPRYIANSITFALGTGLDREKFSTQARQFIPAEPTQNQPGPELYQQLLSFDFLHFCELGNLGRINPKSQLKKSDLAATESWDYVLTIDSQNLGVRVIALRSETMSQIGDDAIEQVLALSANSLQKAALSVEPQHKWQSSILFVWTDLYPEDLERLQKIWENLGTTTKGSTILYAVSIKGGGFMLCRPPTHTGEECRR